MGSSPGVVPAIFCLMFVMYIAFCVRVVFGEETAAVDQISKPCNCSSASVAEEGVSMADMSLCKSLENMLLYAILGYVPLILCVCLFTRDMRKTSTRRKRAIFGPWKSLCRDEDEHKH
ncbi:uncharacterized protein [Amphiura filiformis]|uniref:uncharacterized protein n=1 Tax=Amphiura filiformis TaxID=82378 RepID=UPI003B223C35